MKIPRMKSFGAVQRIKQADDEKDRDVLDVVFMHASRTLDIFVGKQLFGARMGIGKGFSRIFRITISAVDLDHSKYGDPPCDIIFTINSTAATAKVTKDGVVEGEQTHVVIARVPIWSVCGASREKLLLSTFNTLAELAEGLTRNRDVGRASEVRMGVRMVSGDTKASWTGWLPAHGRRRTRPLASELCDRLLGCAFPIWRVGLFVHTLHPHIVGQRFLWKTGSAVDVNSAPLEAFQSEEFRNSPVRRVIDTGIAVRRRLADKDCPVDFTMLRELRNQDVTDYLAVPLFFADGTVHGATFRDPRRPRFHRRANCDIESIAAPLSRVVENRTLRRTATALLDTYVGNQAGREFSPDKSGGGMSTS